MKMAFLIMSALLFLSSFGRGEGPPTLVRAVVIDLQKVPEEKLPGEVARPLLNQRVLWKALLKIDAVYQGPANINEETMALITSDHIPYGNIRSITPKLQMGDVGIFAIEPLREKGQWRSTYLQPAIDGAELPLIKGRHADYDRISLSLSGIKEQKTDAPSPGSPDSTSADKKMRSGEAEGQSSASQFIWSVLAVIMSLAILIFLSRRVGGKKKPA